jgi:hypothetical protein
VDYLSGINEGGVHEDNIASFDLKSVLIENHFPEFDVNEINEARHRDVHIV